VSWGEFSIGEKNGRGREISELAARKGGQRKQEDRKKGAKLKSNENSAQDLIPQPLPVKTLL